jgi:hypothetical protein
LLDVRAFTTNQDTLLRRPFRTEIVNPLNRKLHCRSVVNSSIQNINNNNANASIKNYNVMSTTTNANLINQLGSQPKIQNIQELSH